MKENFSLEDLGKSLANTLNLLISFVKSVVEVVRMFK